MAQARREAPQPKLSYVANFRPWDWNFIAGLYLDDIEAAFRAELTKAFGILLGVGLLMSLVMVRVAASLQRQLGGEPAITAHIAGRIAEGDLGSQVEVRPGDEHSVLYAMQRMQARLTGAIGSIRGSADSIAGAAKQIAAGNADLRAAAKNRPRRCRKPPPAWSSSPAPCARAPRTRARPATWPKARRTLRCAAAPSSARWWTPWARSRRLGRWSTSSA